MCYSENEWIFSHVIPFYTTNIREEIFMNKTFIRLSSLALAAIIAVNGLAVNVNAAELESQVLDSDSTFHEKEESRVLESNEAKDEVFYEAEENVGVSVVEDINDYGVYSTIKPILTWNLSKNGSFPFSGNSNRADLYTNYYVTGKSSIRIIVNNKNNLPLTVSFKRANVLLDTNLQTYKIAAGRNLDVTWSVNSSSQYYLLFAGPSNFSGSIR